MQKVNAKILKGLFGEGGKIAPLSIFEYIFFGYGSETVGYNVDFDLGPKLVFLSGG